MPNTPIYNIEDTWNNESAVFDAIKINVTDTASDPLSKLLDLKVGGISQFKVDKAGNVTASGTIAGLDQVDNVADLDKPVSTLQQAAIDAAGGGAFDADADTLITPSTPIVLDQATGDEAALTLDYTTNKATSGDDTGLLINQTDTNSPGASKLVDLQVGGTSKFSVDTTGAVVASSINTGVGNYDGSVSSYKFSQLNGNFSFKDYLKVKRGNSFGWTDNINLALDAYLTSDAANTISQRNGVNAQEFRLYNTDDDAGNTEYLSAAWSANDVTLTVDSEGSGINRPLFIRGQTLFLGGAKGANHWKVSTAGHLLDQTDGAHNIGQLGSNRPNSIYLTGNVGLNGATPPAQAAHVAAATDAASTQTLANALRTALIDLGAMAAS
jgi:hypothetical protein